MSGRIPPRPPRPSGAAAGGGAARTRQRRPQPVELEHGAPEAAADADAFSQGPPPRRPTGGDPLERQLQQLPAGALRALRLPAAELAALAQQFAQIVRDHPGASRGRRAQLFARAILRRRPPAALFAALSEAELDAMCELIGESLEDAPRFAELVDRASQAADNAEAPQEPPARQP